MLFHNNEEDKKRIIIRRYRCIFDSSRKEGDDHNMITLQALKLFK